MTVYPIRDQSDYFCRTVSFSPNEDKQETVAFLQRLRHILGDMILRFAKSKRLFNTCFLAVTLGVAGFGCATKPKRPPAAGVPVPHLVGTVELVNEPLGFVLIDAGSLYLPGAGKALKCFSNGTESGVLTVSPERKGPFVTADIVKGSPHKGDQVFE